MDHSVTEEKTPPRSGGGWKRAILFGLAFGVGIAGTLAVAGGAFYLHQNRKIPAHTWNTISLEPAGIKVFLKTEGLDGEVRYQFTVAPLSRSLADAFDTFTSTTTAQNDLFTISFYDEDGFELCHGDPGTLTRLVGDNGKVSALEGNGVLSGCAVNQYASAKSWNLNYRFPDVKTWGPSPATAPTAEPPATPVQADVIAKPIEKRSPVDTAIGGKIVEGQDSISGVAPWRGEVETKAGHTFRVLREGEQMTTAAWSAGESIHYNCKGTTCSLDNVTLSQTVHAKMSR